MKNSFIGSPIERREDLRFLRGRGEYVDDVARKDMLHAAILRSSVAHGRIRSIDTGPARALPGVHSVITAKDIGNRVPRVPMRLQPLPDFEPFGQPVIAETKVRYVGEAIALVLADSPGIAEDAVGLIEVQIEALPAVADRHVSAKNESLLFEETGTNQAIKFHAVRGDAAAAFKIAPYTRRESFRTQRHMALPMEPRGLLAEWDAARGRLTVSGGAKVLFFNRRTLAKQLGLSEDQIEIVENDVGGGFGARGEFYPEDFLIPFAARQTGRPVKWTEDRREHFISSSHERGQLQEVTVGFDDDGRILALRDDFIVDCGAWNPIGAGVVYNTAVHLTGPYKIAALAISARIAATNKVPNAPYRGAGRPEAAFAMERIIDLVAAARGLEPADVRLRNMIRADEMPYRVGIPYRDGEPIVYDGGDYPAALRKALEAIGGVDAFRARQRAARDDGRHLGLGIGCYVEGTGVGPFESATVRIDPSGKILVSGGACPQGQGMETIFAQVVADAWSVEPDDVVMALADTAAIAIGFGTIASRSTVTLSAAIHGASDRLRAKVFAIAANLLECATGDLELRNGGVGIVGVPGADVSLAKVAQAARPGWDHGRPSGVDAGLEETFYYEPPTVTWSYAVHVAVLEVDIELGRVSIEQYVIAHDCGVVVNPMLVEGQIVGGAAQGIGGALLEEFNYDSEGQLLAGSLADYIMPTACDIPHMHLIHQHSPSPLNPLGVKGVGEGGAIAPPAAIANAVCDALHPFKVELNRLPLKPERIREAIAMRV
jgi:carbon-monoxide dehydrogenase large subunit